MILLGSVSHMAMYKAWYRVKKVIKGYTLTDLGKVLKVLRVLKRAK